MDYNKYIDINSENERVANDFSGFDRIGAGQQSTAFDLSKFIVKTMDVKELPSDDIIRKIPFEPLKPTKIEIMESKALVFQKRVDIDIFTPIVSQLIITCSELIELHKAGLVYNDLKKDNIVFGHLVDFGLICRTGDHPHMFIESLFPPGWKDNPKSTPETDLYALIKLLSEYGINSDRKFKYVSEVQDYLEYLKEKNESTHSFGRNHTNLFFKLTIIVLLFLACSVEITSALLLLSKPDMSKESMLVLAMLSIELLIFISLIMYRASLTSNEILWVNVSQFKSVVSMTLLFISMVLSEFLIIPLLCVGTMVTYYVLFYRSTNEIRKIVPLNTLARSYFDETT